MKSKGHVTSESHPFWARTTVEACENPLDRLEFPVYCHYPGCDAGPFVDGYDVDEHITEEHLAEAVWDFAYANMRPAAIHFSISAGASRPGANSSTRSELHGAAVCGDSQSRSFSRLGQFALNQPHQYWCLECSETRFAPWLPARCCECGRSLVEMRFSPMRQAC